MVHLASVATDAEVNKPVVEGLSASQFFNEEADTFTASVYGSSFAAEDLPRHEMPEKEMPKEVAYRMIKCVALLRLTLPMVLIFSTRH